MRAQGEAIVGTANLVCAGPFVLRAMYLWKYVKFVNDRTSFSVMSLVSRTARGRAAIRDAGWESARDPSTHVFLPQDPSVLFQVIDVALVLVCESLLGHLWLIGTL